MTKIDLRAPLDGVIPLLEQVPDPVFSQKMVGDRISIDPSNQLLSASYGGIDTQLYRAHPAVTGATSEGVEVIPWATSCWWSRSESWGSAGHRLDGAGGAVEDRGKTAGDEAELAEGAAAPKTGALAKHGQRSARIARRQGLATGA